jgi:hypothetical protein
MNKRRVVLMGKRMDELAMRLRAQVGGEKSVPVADLRLLATFAFYGAISMMDDLFREHAAEISRPIASDDGVSVERAREELTAEYLRTVCTRPGSTLGSVDDAVTHIALVWNLIEVRYGEECCFNLAEDEE